jgi:hypothetical protein
LREVFGNAAPNWEKTLLAEVPLDEIAPPTRKTKLPPTVQDDEPEQVEIPTVPFQLPPHALDEIRRPAKKVPAPNPNAPGSAEEGRSA